MGALEGLSEVEQKKELGSRIDDIIKEKGTARIGVFESGDATIEAPAKSFAVEIMEKKQNGSFTNSIV